MKRDGNLKESGQADADGRWRAITVIVIIISVIGAGDKPWAGALPLPPAPGMFRSSESHWNSVGSRGPRRASLLGGLSPLRAVQRER